MSLIGSQLSHRIVEGSQDWRLTVVRNEPTTQAALDAWEPAPIFEDDLDDMEHAIEDDE